VVDEGLATEGGRAALAYGFQELSQERIISVAEPENAASLKVSRQLGMEVERETVHPELGVCLVVMSITRRQWELETV
jgi:RimJ/RimL family protein N-acetyltransferase